MACLEIHEEICKGCGLCINFCPRSLITLAEHLNSKGFHPAVLKEPEKCNACTLCAIMCPDMAIEIRKEAG